MTPGRVVIVGAGQGGFQAAASLRQDGFAGRITLIGDEPGLPYQRPPLSKAYMKDGEADRLLMKPAAFYERSEIDYRAATRAVEIDRAAGRVLTADGGAHAYDHLILATGARNFLPPIAGLDAAGVHGLRTLADAADLRARIADGGSAVVIGGGFIGLEFAAVARAAGVDVTVLEAAGRLMGRVVSPEVSAHFLALHEAMGTRVLLDARAEAVEPGAVLLADGRRIEAGMILLAAGVRPNAELAAEAGLAVANGVVVSDRLLTDDPAISALGDCACFPLAGGRRVRLESVQAAVDHARHIARRLADLEDAPYGAVAWFWSDQGEHKLQIAGLALDADRHVAAPSPPGRLIVLSLAGDRLVAVETVNAPGPHMATRKLLAAGRPVTLAEIEAADFDLLRLAKG
ncbi:FAD-dependent oxidoreductase [Amaricoccus sp.]|uniref:NAD(P)/FAD-dependent oxidoreductase n=1 Tax=Amaricoccus sp. TaxID=1872485 RepID=UPI001B492536|nr:FAD-dependent oxidoreductase [Amaricoccus sp.]MBP7241266.1 FAD-dependent oxidoreductase [Amaricoccus sp.]